MSLHPLAEETSAPWRLVDLNRLRAGGPAAWPQAPGLAWPAAAWPPTGLDVLKAIRSSCVPAVSRGALRLAPARTAAPLLLLCKFLYPEAWAVADAQVVPSPRSPCGQGRVRGLHRGLHACHEFLPLPSRDEVSKKAFGPFWEWKKEQSEATREETPWRKTEEDCPCAVLVDRMLQQDLSSRSPGFGKHHPGGPGSLRNPASGEVCPEMHACFLGPGSKTCVHTRGGASQWLRQPRRTGGRFHDLPGGARGLAGDSPVVQHPTLHLLGHSEHLSRVSLVEGGVSRS
ncbi:uncharacterized protein LOC121485575 [Vulpes lagopus]|uniref:uncharacterized protein LOC121485575 n=1 Tax=Vulpes lagopus TaxID=494514 RepID=UPI001BC93D48|nr:uncharacterized protein LOC121485575 [Vulpes lagopus]